MRRSPCMIDAAMAPELLALAVQLEEALRQGQLKRAPKLQTAAQKFLRKLSKNGRLIGRRMELVKLLAEGTRSGKQLIGRLPTTRRTFYRDLNALEDAGLEIELTPDGFYRLT